MWARSNSQSTEENKKCHQVNKQEKWLWNSDLLGEGLMRMKGGHLFFKYRRSISYNFYYALFIDIFSSGLCFGSHY